MLLTKSIRSRGPMITIRFAEGYGLKVGDVLRFRGIAIGEVTDAELTSDLGRVGFRVRLEPKAAHVARRGSQFWIERARVSLSHVSGLETVVGAKFLGVIPGPADGPTATEFDGIESPPISNEPDLAPVAQIPVGALEVILHAPQRFGVEGGVPVTYRGLRVGQVITIGLSSDGTNLEARAFIESRFRSLVRQNSVFWSSSGVGASLGVTGLHVTAEPLSSIVQGGVAFATPANFGPPANTGQRFAYVKSPQDEWLNWQPRIALNDVSLPNEMSLPAPRRAVARWEERVFGIRRGHERAAWVLLLSDGQLLGPSDVLLPTENTANPASLEFVGKKLDLVASRTQRMGKIALFRPDDLQSDGVSAWKVENMRREVIEPEDCLAVADPHAPPIPLAATSLEPREHVWEVRSATGLSPALHGAAVIAVKDGCLIGQLLFDRGKASIAILPAVR